MKITLIYGAVALFFAAAMGNHFWPGAPLDCMAAISLLAACLGVTVGLITEWFARRL